MAEVLRAEGLTKRFGDFTAVDGIGFGIGQGEIVGLLGPNGAGKTTTIQMLMGLITPTAGTITVFGRDLAREREAIMQRVNFSSTYVQLPFTLSVRENLRVFGRLYGIPRRNARVEEIMADLDLLGMAEKPTKSLSSGQLTRLHLAKALLNDPELLYLDEPTASLDPDTADRMRTYLKGVRDRTGLSMLYTSHNMREMEIMCDRIIFLHQGRILLTGTPEELVTESGAEDLEALFLAIARGERAGGQR
ncbi:MAG: ABC transporter ATP-binding protein [Candidatus Sericytochromatia bacterium]